jgi:hypothetical protein
MPLPFAPPPKDSSLYQQLESTTLQTLTADQLATIRAKTFSQGTEGNEDEYRRLLLLGLASDKLSLSGPIPGTGQSSSLVNLVTVTDNTLTSAFTPEAGEIWELVSFGANVTGRSGTLTWQLYWYDNTTGEYFKWYYYSAATDEPAFPGDGDWGQGSHYITENVELKFTVTGTITDCDMKFYLVRVRG